MTRAILDDHLLRDFLADDVPAELDMILSEHQPATTNFYLYRLCRSVVAAAGGALTRAVECRASTPWAEAVGVHAGVSG